MPTDFTIKIATEEERNQYINRLLEELPVLRTMLGISQDELANLLGISRQTYSSMETKRRKMSWPLFLSLILILDNNEQTHEHIRQSGIFPQRLFNRTDNQGGENALSSFIQMDGDNILNHLDEQAVHAIETVIMVEYARCNKLPGDAVVKAFDGKRLSQISDNDAKITAALRNIKAGAGK